MDLATEQTYCVKCNKPVKETGFRTITTYFQVYTPSAKGLFRSQRQKSAVIEVQCGTCSEKLFVDPAKLIGQKEAA